ncbi:hypothetical protein DYQ86_15080 [Acidobacteria bacterium AB60]|nr:hypothetical protein DYQ86_15080 [Acidobacteria bacterium AB60]
MSLPTRSATTARCSNPWALDRDPSGSSSGSAAVAVNLAYGALGTDTGGLIWPDHNPLKGPLRQTPAYLALDCYRSIG